MKGIIFVGQAQKAIAKFPKTAKTRIVGLLDMLRAGLTLPPKDMKSMPTVGPGVYELRIRLSTQYRVFYVAKYNKAIYVLHAFVKKTQQTSKSDIEIGRHRYKALISELKRKKS